jgi:hypothetical protein
LILVVVILLSPFVAALKRLKIGEFEAEIDPEEVKNLAEEVSQKVPVIQTEETLLDEESGSVGETIRDLARNDPVVALAKLRIELERTTNRLYSRSNGERNLPRHIPLGNLVRELAVKQIIPSNLAQPIKDVLALCNRAVHGEAIRDQDARSVIESGVELLQVLEKLSREYGIAHPVSKETISGEEVEKARTARYRVTTIIPLVKSPQRVTYDLTHEELEEFFDGYAEFGEFVVGVEKIP